MARPRPDRRARSRCAALGAMTLALAREVGLLRMRVGPASALEIPHEGPEVGSRTEIAGLDRRPRAARSSGLAVFTSAGCHVCEAMRPAVDSIAAHPAVAVGRFDEVAQSEAWAGTRRPGKPVRCRPGFAGNSASQGNLQQPRSARVDPRRRRAPARRPRGGGACLSARSATGSARRSTESPATPRAAGSSPGSGER